ncbi:MAG: hypothetical protein NZM43_13905, partial [Saprospiraceae bacterium]|nr:hypothetical protein [Saprospiraceae bacterium]MDW8485409.1 hypothetical protein [Saprospiraceae bacterium]
MLAIAGFCRSLPSSCQCIKRKHLNIQAIRISRWITITQIINLRLAKLSNGLVNHFRINQGTITGNANHY